MKRIVSLALALVLVLSLTACGGKDGGKSADPNLGKYIGTEYSSDGDTWYSLADLYDSESYIELKSGGKGVFCLGGEATDICDEEHRAYFARLKEPAETVGLNMQLPPEIRPRPMTYLAFEGAVLAEKSGKHEAWSDRVYRAYWVDGRDIGQIDVLCVLAADIGLNADEMRQALENRAYADDVKTAIQHTLDTYHPRGVPILFVNGQRIRLRAYTLPEMTDVLRGVIPAEENQEETGCSADGCRLNW